MKSKLPVARMSRVLVVSLVLFLWGLIFLTFTFWQELGLLEILEGGGELSQEQIDTHTGRRLASIWVALGMSLFSCIFFMWWVARANRALRDLGSELSYTPGWTVAHFWIPILSLFRPYQNMREMWIASGTDSAADSESSGSPLVGSWWTLWIIGMAILHIAEKFEESDAFSNDDIANNMYLAGGVLIFALTMVAIVMVRKLTERIVAKHGRMSGEAPLPTAQASTTAPTP